MRLPHLSTLRKAAKTLALSLLATALPVAASAQFNKVYDNQSDERAQSVRRTSDGGFITAGYVQNVVGWQTLLMKTDASGVLQWSKNIIPSTWGGSDYPLYPADVFYAVRELPQGGYVSVGYTNQYTSVPWVLADENVLIVRTDASGNVVWRTVYGGLQKDRGYNLEVINDGDHIVVTGIMDQEFSDMGIEYNSKLFIMKIDAAGTLQWCSKTGVTSPGLYDHEHYAGHAVQQLTDGSFVAVGTCSNPTYSWQRSVYAARVSSTGGLLWANAYTNANVQIHGDIAHGLRQMSDGGIVVSGSANNFTGSAYNDVFLMKILPLTGQELWTKRYYIDGYNNFGHELHKLSNDDLVLSGVTAYAGPSVSLMKFNSSGNLSWARYYPNATSEGTSSMDVVPGERDGEFIVSSDPNAFHLVRTDASGNSYCDATLPLEEQEVEFRDDLRGDEYTSCHYAYTVAYPYDYDLETTSCSELEKSGSNAAPAIDEAFVSLSPNPAFSGAVAGVNFTLAGEAKVHVQFTDLAGTELFTAESVYGAGTHTVSLPTQNLMPGVYMAHLTIAGARTTQKLVIIR